MWLLAGAATAAPLAAGAQQKTPVIGLLSEGRAVDSGFQQGLSATGYIEGQNVTIDYQLAGGGRRYERLPSLAAGLVRSGAAVIVAVGSAAAQAVKRATATTPVVFLSPDPVAEGLVPSLARPGGNLTGVSLMGAELMPKRVELLAELVPQAKLFALIVNPNGPAASDVIREAQEGAHARGLRLEILKASTDAEIESAFAVLRQLRADGLLVETDPFFNTRNSYFPVLAAAGAVPVIYGNSLDAWAGGLISYGSSLESAWRQLGVYAGRILKGEKPADLPVQQPDKFELAINMKTAKALGLAVPRFLLAQADTVIE